MGRVVATSVGVAIVAVGAWWIMRMPPPPIELSIPFAASTTVNSVNSSSSSQTVTSSTIPLTILVDVAGEVIHPGVVVIAGGSRVIDALNAAGGPTSRADLDVVNLAAALVDGAQVYVPKHGETTKRAVTRPIPGVNLPPQSIGSSTPGQAVTEPVDLNSATEQQLDTLPGVGPSTARAIITYRLQHGPFARVEDLLNVRGIGPAKFEALLGLVRV
jgi:competence protein ComEA